MTPEPNSQPAPAPAVRGQRAITGIFLILLLGALYLAREFLLPVTVALLLFFVLMPVQRVLQRTGVPASLSAGGLVLTLLLVVSLLFSALGGPAVEAARDYPRLIEQVADKVRTVRDAFRPDPAPTPGPTLGTLPDPTALPEPMAPPPERPDPVPDVPEEEDDAAALVQSTATGALSYLTAAPAVMAQIAFALFLLFFLLSSGDLLYLRILQSFDTFRDKRAAHSALRRIERHLGGYIGTVTAINAGLGVVIGLAMWALDMPAPLMFAVMAFTLNFIPYVGAIAGGAIAGAVAVITFNDWQTPLLVLGVYLLLTSLEGQLITPALLARKMQMNTVVVFASVAFWAWIWGAAGMLIAVPLMVALRVIASEVPGWHKLVYFLSGEDTTEPPPNDR